MDWADAPLQLRLQDCEAAIRRGAGGKNPDHAAAPPTRLVANNSDAENRSALEELDAARTQLLASTTADGTSPVTMSATQSTTTAVKTGAFDFAAPRAPATPQTAASSAPFYLTGGTPEAAEIRKQAAVPATAFSFGAPVVGYKGLTTVDVSALSRRSHVAHRTYHDNNGISSQSNASAAGERTVAEPSAP